MPHILWTSLHCNYFKGCPSMMISLIRISNIFYYYSSNVCTKLKSALIVFGSYKSSQLISLNGGPIRFSYLNRFRLFFTPNPSINYLNHAKLTLVQWILAFSCQRLDYLSENVFKGCVGHVHPAPVFRCSLIKIRPYCQARLLLISTKNFIVI